MVWRWTFILLLILLLHFFSVTVAVAAAVTTLVLAPRIVITAVLDEVLCKILKRWESQRCRRVAIIISTITIAVVIKEIIGLFAVC